MGWESGSGPLVRVRRRRGAGAERRSGGRRGGPVSMALIVPLVVALTVMTGAATAQAAACRSDGTPVTLTFRSVFDRASLDHTESVRTITTMFRRSQDDATIARDGDAVGLTVTRTEFRFSAQTEVFEQPGGWYCVHLRSVDAHLDQRDTIIYVAREYPRGSCNFDVIYEHEKQHMRIYYRTLQSYAPRVKAALQSLLNAMPPRRVRTMEEARVLHAEDINSGMQGLLDALEAERKQLNAALDTPQNYTREREKCPSW